MFRDCENNPSWLDCGIRKEGVVKDKVHEVDLQDLCLPAELFELCPGSRERFKLGE